MKKLKRLFANKSQQEFVFQKMFGVAVAGASLAAFGAQAQAQTVISDNFTNSPASANNPTQLPASGIAPDGTNLPGGTWVSTGGNFYDSRIVSGATTLAIGTVTGYASARNNGTSDGISVQSSGGYVEPNALNISASINPFGPNEGAGNTTTGTPTENLGFFTLSQSAQYTYGSLANFFGVQLSSTGVLQFDLAGSNTSTGINAGSGIYDSNGFVTLSFNEAYNSGTNMTTISNIVLDGVSYSATDSATGNYLEFAGFQGSGGGFPMGNAITDFVVSGVSAAPEPSTYALLAGGALALGAYQYRRRQQGGI